MPYPWANVILLLLLAAELGTGLFGLVSGSSDRAIFLHLHRIFGFAILAVFLWKGRNIFSSLARLKRRRATRPAPIPYGSLATMLLLALSVTLALAWSHTGPFQLQGFSGVSWHIYVSVPLAPLLLWHAFSHRWTLRPIFWAQRRNFLRTGGLALAGLALWQVAEFSAFGLKLPGSQRRFTGSLRRRQLFRQQLPLDILDKRRPTTHRPCQLDSSSNGPRRTRTHPRLSRYRRPQDATDRHPRLHWRLALYPKLDGHPSATGTGPGWAQGRRCQCHRSLRHRLHPPFLNRRDRRAASRHHRRRRNPIPSTRLPPPARRPRPARLPVGQVGNSPRSQRHQQVASISVAPAVTGNCVPQH